MKEKLTLETIVPYCIYGLTGYFFDKYDIVTSIDFEYKIISSLNNGNVFINDFKPLLHPLSKLTKEIEHDGEKFVPILKVLEILKIYPISYNILENSIDIILDPKKHRANVRTKENRKIRFWFNNFNGIGFYCSNMKLFMYKDIYGAIKKLFEWHFDVFDLHSKNQCIYYDELKK